VGVRAGAVADVVVNAAFWGGRRVLVTGHTGFKGAWLTLWLQELGAEVVGVSRGVPTEPSLYVLARAGERVTEVVADVRDPEALHGAVAEHAPDVVLHLAAQPLVRLSYEDPRGTYETNVMGTVNVLDAVRRAGGVGVVVNVTSDKCYENREWDWGYREDEPKGGHDPYSSSKGCSELVTEAYRRSFFSAAGATRLASARAGNVFGGGDWAADRLVPDLMRAAAAGEPVRLRNPDAVRPWQHVLNPLSGYLLLAERAHADAAFADGWNFGPPDDDARAVRWIAEQLGARWEPQPGEHPHEARALKLDSSRAHARLGWRPRWDLGEGLRRTLAWHEAQRAGEDVRDVSLAQIRAYSEA
jgi:CDP-glucose 4,6-dehydratase